MAEAEGALRLAKASLQAARYEDAVAPLLEALRLLPENAAVLNDLGVAYLFTRRVPQAIDAFRRSLAVCPGAARTHFSLGLALAQAGSFDAALASHERAVALQPDLADAHGRIGDLFARKGMTNEAAAAYARAHAASPSTPYGKLCGAKALASAGRQAEAEAAFRDVVEAAPSNGEAHLALANLLAEAGRMDEAGTHYEKSIEVAPWQTTAYQGLVASRRMTDGDRPIVARIESRLAVDDLADRQRMMLHFAAGKAHDDLRDAARAIAHFDAANAIRRTIAPFDRARFAERVERIMRRFTKASFARAAATGSRDETPVLVLGMPRSGTTLFERMLSGHPKVGGGGEITFWDTRGPEWSTTTPSELQGGARELREGYVRVLRSVAPDALRVTDKMPFNFQWIGLVHELFPRARFVHCRRGPIDTCLSIYMTYFSRDWGFGSDRADLAWYYRQYARLMDHWRAVLPPGAMLEVDYEAATAAPEDAARRLVAFSGLEWDAACAKPDANADAVRTANKWEARQPVYRTSVERWRAYEAWLGELRELATSSGDASR